MTTFTPRTTEPQSDVLLEIKNLHMYFPVTSGILFQHTIGNVRAIDNVSFKIMRGETLGLVGESGCGKTTLGRCLLQLIRPTSGEVIFDGVNLVGMKGKALQAIRKRMQIIFQDPYGSLNPRMTAGNIIGEPLSIHGLTHNRREHRDRIRELLSIVGLSSTMADRFPHEFSGGQRQRIGIARALAVDPEFIVCDEPLSALDVSIQAQIINLLRELQDKFRLTYLFIAHDLSVVRNISDRIAVMYLGKIVETADCERIYSNPLHPYTKALISAIPIPNIDSNNINENVILSGEVPNPANPPSGCTFHPRCFMATQDCDKILPLLKEIEPRHKARCINLIGYNSD